MPDGIRWVGLDAHARESTFAIFDQATGELTTRRVVGRPHELLPWLPAVESPGRMVYEAGPTGYGLARRARAEGIEVAVCAPGKTDRPPADRVKTDKRDAIRLARLLAAGELTLVTIPSVEREQLRDLVRCREDIRQDLMRARHRIGKFLLRREIYWEGPGEAWSRKHRSWLTSVRFSDHASQAPRADLADYLHPHDVLIARRDQVEADLSSSRPASRARTQSPGCGACARSTRPPRSGCAPRSASGSALIIPTSSPPTSGSSPPSTPPARSAGSGRSPRPAPPTPGGCWSRPPTTTAAAPPSVKRSSAANAAKHPRSSTSPGARNAASTPAGANSKTPAANPAGSSLSRSPANSPPTARRSPPGLPIPTRCRHPCRRATPSRTQPRSRRSRRPAPAGGSPTRAKRSQPVAASEAARASRLAHNNSAKCRLSTTQPGDALDFRRRTCDEPRSWGTQPPNMSTPPAPNPADPRPAPQAATKHPPPPPQPTLAINPQPLDNRSSIWAT